MFGGGMIDVRIIDDKLFIDMYQLTVHLLHGARDVLAADDNEPTTLSNAVAISQTLALVAATLSELAIYTLEKDSVENVDEILKMWSSKKD